MTLLNLISTLLFTKGPSLSMWGCRITVALLLRLATISQPHTATYVAYSFLLCPLCFLSLEFFILLGIQVCIWNFAAIYKAFQGVFRESVSYLSYCQKWNLASIKCKTNKQTNPFLISSYLDLKEKNRDLVCM